MSTSRIIDGALVAGGTVQVVMVDFQTLVWQDIIQHPIQAMVGIATIILIAVRTARVIQKMFRKRT